MRPPTVPQHRRRGVKRTLLLPGAGWVIMMLDEDEKAAVVDIPHVGTVGLDAEAGGDGPDGGARVGCRGVVRRRSVGWQLRL